MYDMRIQMLNYNWTDFKVFVVSNILLHVKKFVDTFVICTFEYNYLFEIILNNPIYIIKWYYTHISYAEKVRIDFKMFKTSFYRY